MKKTILLAVSLFVLLATATFVYNNYNPELAPQLEETTDDSNSHLEQENATSQDSELSESTEGIPNTIPAVDFTVYDKDGNPINLSAFYGKPIIINFWATWC